MLLAAIIALTSFIGYVALGLSGVVVVLGVAVAGLLVTRPRQPEAEIAPLPQREQVAQLRQSRQEIVGAFEIERRRIERDLHDGAQQYLVSTAMNLGELELSLEPGSEAAALLARAQASLDDGLKALRSTVHGIHPQVLSDLGLEASVRDLASRSGAEVRCPHRLPPMPEGVTACGYFLVSEALTNAAKFAPGSHVTILLVADNDLHISITDDGPGGASVELGHGLSGMKERLATVGGSLSVTSPPGGPTIIAGRIPLLIDEGVSSYL